MRFFSSILAGAAIVAGVLAQKPTIDTILTEVKAGTDVEIEYRPATATATFILRKGQPGNLDTLDTLTENASGGKFTWSVPEDLENDDDYALQIVVNGDDNYSGQFEVSGGSDEEPSSSSSASSASATSASSSRSASASATTSSVGTISSSASRNGTTITTATLTGTSASATESTTPTESSSDESSSTGGGPPEETGAASSLSSSPLALVFGAVAAMAYLN